MNQPDLPLLLLEAIRYEHWLRFYFLKDDEALEENRPETDPDAGFGLAARLVVPEAVAEASRKAEPHLAPLLDALADQPVTLEGSRDAVFCHVAERSGLKTGDPAFGESLIQLVADPEFRRGLDAFHGWVQELANGETSVPDAGAEDGAVPVFAVWQAAFFEWEKNQAVQHITTISPLGVVTSMGSADASDAAVSGAEDRADGQTDR